MLLGAGLLTVAVGLGALLLLRSDGPGAPEQVAPGCAVRVSGGPVAIGAAAPTFRLPGIDGGCVALSEFRGRPVVVNFWASWCRPCRKEFPLLRRVLERHADDDLVVIGIVFRDIPSDARSFADEFGASWPLALDDDADAAAAYGVRPIPQTFFVDRDGVVVRRVFGLTTLRGLERHLEEIL